MPAEPSTGDVVRGYFVLGVQHILGGWDHLLFVTGLLLIARGWRALLLAVSGFTLAHSLTLSLAALGFVHVPIPPTEAAIALSILFLAREALQPPGRSLAQRFPLFVSALFGLLHGLGFAAALGEVGLPPARDRVGAAVLQSGCGSGAAAVHPRAARHRHDGPARSAASAGRCGPAGARAREPSWPT